MSFCRQVKKAAAVTAWGMKIPAFMHLLGNIPLHDLLLAGKAGCADAGTGLPNNRACPLIAPFAVPEGDLMGSRQTGKAPRESRTVQREKK
jgi:hypothetical protein